MPSNKQRRRERARTKPTTAEHAELGPPGHADPARHIERLIQLVVDDYSDDPQEFYTFVDVDLDRRLRRRGWQSLGDIDGEGWFYAPSTPDPSGEPYPEISREDQDAEAAAIETRLAWANRAQDRRHNIETEDGLATAVAELGPMPAMAGARADAVEPTSIQVEAAGYKVIPAGFNGDVEEQMITDRHQLWNALTEIEAIRHVGPYYRLRRWQ